MKLLLGIEWKANFEKIKSKSILQTVKGSPGYLQGRPTFCKNFCQWNYWQWNICYQSV